MYFSNNSYSSGGYSLNDLVNASPQYLSGGGDGYASVFSSYMKSIESIAQSPVYTEAAYSSGGMSYMKSDDDEDIKGIETAKELTSEVVFEPEFFLRDNRPKTQFINTIYEVEELVKKTFKLTTGKDFSSDITISILDFFDLKFVHKSFGGVWSDNIQGFAVNRPGAKKEVFVKQNEMDKLMLVIGHEIGHCLSPPKDDVIEEEAKAFAFEMAWMKTIHKHNLGNLAECIDIDKLKPAKNGVHDVAFKKVKDLLYKGKIALDVFSDIVYDNLLDKNQFGLQYF